MLARPPLAARAPRLVLCPPRRHAQVRREPAEKIRGHLSARLLVRRSRQPLECLPRHPAVLDLPRREYVPRRQSAHQAVRLLAVAHRRHPRPTPRRDLSLRGLHPPQAHEAPRQTRLHTVVHVLHLADHVVRAARISRGAHAAAGARISAAQLLRQHAGHPARVPATRRTRGVPRPVAARRHAVAALRHLQRIRARRKRAAQAGQRRVPRLGEVRAQARDWASPASLDLDIVRVNRLRRENRALQRATNLTFHHSDNDRILFYHKTAGDLGPPNDLLIAVNLDPLRAQDTVVEVPLDAIGVAPGAAYVVEDLLTGARYTWRGSRNYVRLDPRNEPGHVLLVRR